MTEQEFKETYSNSGVHIVTCRKLGDEWLVCELWEDDDEAPYYTTLYLVQESGSLSDGHHDLRLYCETLEQAMTHFMQLQAKRGSGVVPRTRRTSQHVDS